jgi:hypothetical protein
LGLTHDDWQRAYALLQFIMQIVTVKVLRQPDFSGSKRTARKSNNAGRQ